MDERERFIRENALVDAIADDIVASRARVSAEEASMVRRLADAWMLAQEQTSRVAAADTARREMPLRCIAAQIGVEARVNDRTIQSRMFDAWRLVELFPATVEALSAGSIMKAHADVMLQTGSVLEEPAVRAAFEEVVLGWAERETPGRTRAYARQLVEKLHPRSMAERHAHAAAERSITVVDLDDGMSQIIARVPTVLAHAIRDRLTRQAKANVAAEAAARKDASATGVEGLPAERTVRQTGADILCDLLLTAAPTLDATADGTLPGGLGAIRAQVQLTMPVTTLTGVTSGGAELDGIAPVDPGTARLLAGDAPIWERVMLHPFTGVVLAVDRYRPTPAQERFVKTRDRHCRMPGCRMPARRCQLDHNHEAHDGGPTAIGNLACLCTRHHTLKTETEWTIRQHADGRLELISPSGRAYGDDPPPRVLFHPDPDPDPDPDPAPF